MNCVISFLGVLLLFSTMSASAADPGELGCAWKGPKIPSRPGQSVEICQKGAVFLSQTAWRSGTCKVKSNKDLPAFTLSVNSSGLSSVSSESEILIPYSADLPGTKAEFPKNTDRRATPDKHWATVSTFYEEDTGEWRLTVIGGAPLRSILGECRTGGYLKD